MCRKRTPFQRIREESYQFLFDTLQKTSRQAVNNQRSRCRVCLGLGSLRLDSRQDGLFALLDLVLLGGQRLLRQVVLLDRPGRLLMLLLRRRRRVLADGGVGCGVDALDLD